MNYHERDASYRAHPGLNQSALKPLKLSPQHALHAATAPRKQSAAMALGVLTERLIACPDDLRMAVKQDGRTTAGKAANAAAEAAGDTMIAEDDWTRAEAMANALRQDPQAAALLAGCEFGQPCYWSQDGQARKALFDAVDVSRHLVVDIKTTSADLTADSLAKEVIKWGYHLQAAWYRQGYRKANGHDCVFWFVFVESSAPHAVVCFQLADDDLDTAELELERMAAVWQRCTDSGVWPGPKLPERLALPRWYVPFEGAERKAREVAVNLSALDAMAANIDAGNLPDVGF
jgi:hypothetical protein